MANVFQLKVVAPDRVLFDGSVKYIHLPGGAGFFGVLADHAPMLASLRPGPFEVRPSTGEPLKFSTTQPGFFEVVHNKASILLDVADSTVLERVSLA